MTAMTRNPSCSLAPHVPLGAPRPVVKSGRAPCYFSIDFEDYAHDFQRTLGVKRPRQDPQSILKAYGLIEAFSKRRLGGARLTFFTTGQVARDYPDIVRRISGDGHEIACHYYEHDQIWHQDRITFRSNLERAVDCLSKASGQVIKGFRAPDFSIDERCAEWAYEELSRFFVYDSSRVADRHEGEAGCPEVMQFAASRLYEFPVYRRQVMPGLNARVVGGTYARLLPTATIIKLLHESVREGFIPQVYFHPYDLLSDYEQWSSFNDLADLALPRRCYWWMRQIQWHSIGNTHAFEKLERIFDEFEHPGAMAELFAEPATHQEQRRHAAH